MAKARRGDKVRLHYTGRLGDGRVFDSTEHAGDEDWKNFRGTGVAFAPAELVLGSGELLPACEDALVGLEPGQQVTITVPAADAFGPRREDAVVVLSRDDVEPASHHLQSFRVAEGRHRPNKFNPYVGDVIEVTAADGSVVPARVTALTEDTITLDPNHPLAGHELVFDLRLVAIVEAAPEP